MSTLADSLRSSSGRPLRLRRRADLVARRHCYQGRSYWVVKEPVGLKYFRFQEEEFAILQMLDGRASLDEIRQQFQSQFAPQKIGLAEVQRFIGMLHRSSLVIAPVAGQGVQLKRRGDEQRRKEWIAAATNILALRFKGVDPRWLLRRLTPLTSWFFSRWMVALWGVVATAALLLVLVQFETFQARLPAFQEFFGPRNWLLLAAVLGVTKILHELGHGLACKRLGGECHEIGLMLLVLTPCLYCNVSDSWMLPSKWQRAAIGAAGMYVELVLAAVATFVWWFSEPGLIHHLALQVMFVCSVSTVLFNGNPLLRYDGYYILADLVEIPNLRQKSSSILNRLLARWCLGMELPEEPFLPKRNQAFFALYTIAAIVYRLLVLVSILLFLYKVFEPYGLKVVGQTIAAFALGSMVLRPAWQLAKFFRVPGRRNEMKRRNVIVTATVVAALVTFILWIPLPRRVACSLEIRPRDAVAVYVDVAGRLDEVLVRSGQEVTAGQPLARLRNVDLRLAVAELAGEERVYEVRLAALRQQRFADRNAAEEIPQVEQALSSTREKIVEERQDLARLELTAPAAGTVLPPPLQAAKPTADGTLGEWSGSPLDRENRGAVLGESVMFCEIGDPHRLEAVLVVDQGDIERLHTDNPVRIHLDAYPHETFSGRIAEIAQGDLKVAPHSLSNQAGGELATRTDAAGIERPLSTSYTARVPLDDAAGRLKIGLRGRAKVDTGWQPLGGRIWRYVSRTFHFWL